MQKYKKAALNIAFLSLLLSGGLTTGYINNNAETKNDKKTEQEEMLLSSFEDNNYDAWKKIMSNKSKIATVIAKDDFEEFVAVRKLARAGKYDQAISATKKIEDTLKLKLENKIIPKE